MSREVNITIDTERRFAGLTAARENYNANRPEDEPKVEATEENPDPVQPVPAPGPFATNDAYASYVWGPVLDSYANQYLGEKQVTDDPDLIGKTKDIGDRKISFVSADEA